MTELCKLSAVDRTAKGGVVAILKENVVGMETSIFGGLPTPGFRHGKDFRVGRVC
jgi:hypothetical protein